MKKKRRTFSAKYGLLSIVVLLIIISLHVFVLQIIQKSTSQLDNSNPILATAELVVERCKDKKYRPGCYDKEIPQYMPKFSMEEAFEITRAVQRLDPEYGYCHVLGHKLSEKEVARDPKRWTEVLTRCPSDGMCANGCLHGAMQGRFRAEYLSDEQIQKVIPELSTACEKRENWNPTLLDQGICYHGLGHLTMFITNADFEKSVSICDQIGLKDDGRDMRSVCYEGLFMQLFQPLEPEDEALVLEKVPEKDKLRAFCESFGDQDVIEACWREGWPLYRNDMETADGITRYCSHSEPGYEDACYSMLFHVIGQNTNFDEQKSIAICSAMNSSVKAKCFSDVGLAMIQADKSFMQKAVSMCAGLKNEADECYSNLAKSSTFNFHPESDEMKKYCSLFPAEHVSSCLGN